MVVVRVVFWDVFDFKLREKASGGKEGSWQASCYFSSKFERKMSVVNTRELNINKYDETDVKISNSLAITYVLLKNSVDVLLVL